MIATENTWFARLYLSGPIEQAKQILRRECFKEGLCVTVEPTLFIYTHGEEQGYVVGLIQYPRFPKTQDEIEARAWELLQILLRETYQGAALMMTPQKTTWVTHVEVS